MARTAVNVDKYNYAEVMRWGYVTDKNLTGGSAQSFLLRLIKLIYPTIMLKWYRIGETGKSEKAIVPDYVVDDLYGR